MCPLVDETKCIGCGACFNVCPVKPKVMEIREIEGKGKKSVIVHPEACDLRRLRESLSYRSIQAH